MTLFDTFGLVSEESHFHVPTSYIFALVAILLTSLSYGHMIRRYPSSGSAYTYAQKIDSPQCRLYGGLVILVRLSIIANGQHHSCRDLP